MVFCVLSVVFLKLLSHLLLVGTLSLKLLSIFGESVISVPQNFFVICLLLKFGLIVTVELFKFRLVFLADFTDEHAVVCAATVLKKNCENFPHISN